MINTKHAGVRTPDYARKIVNRIMAPLNTTLRKFERLGAGDYPAARTPRAKIAGVKARMEDNSDGEA